MKTVKKYILEQVNQKVLAPADAAAFLEELESKETQSHDTKIAVIGMACDLSEAMTYHEFWDNLMHERDCLGYAPRKYEDRYTIVGNPNFAKVMGTKPFDIEKNHFTSRSSYLQNMDEFDAAFFGIPPREARYIEPGQRIFLQTACGAIEDAGYSLEDVRGDAIGVFAGKDHNNAEFYKLETEPDTLATTGSWHGILASRISYLFNFRGPAIVVDTACSSGLVAVHQACRALQAGDCTMALAGGVAVGGSPADGSKEEGEVGDALDTVSASDSIVRPFDKKSKGTVFGEGCAVVLLKPLQKALEDGDPIHAVILSSAINNDGASNGITAPNPEAQTDLLCRAWKEADIDPRTLSYFECHGTGTLLGDPIEFKALNKAIRTFTDENQVFGFGSVKSNVGHLIAASGVVGLIKVILSMQHKTIPASIHFEEPNPHIDFLHSALYPVDHAMAWEEEETPLRAGVSSFGFSGTNVHVVVESAEGIEKEKKEEKEDVKEPAQSSFLLTLSAKTQWSLEKMLHRLVEALEKREQTDIEALSATLNLGRGHYNYRLIVSASTVDNALDVLRKLDIQGLDTPLEGVLYGYFKVVSDRRMDRSEGELTESEIREWNRKAKAILEHIGENDLTPEQQTKLMEAYVHGASIDFAQLYAGHNIRRMHLPTYVFEKTSYWAEVKSMDSLGGSVALETYSHPLVERLILRSVDQDIYATTFSVDKHWILHDHVIMGNNIIPGTAYVELGREVCAKYIDGPLEMRELTFLAPLRVDEGDEVEAQIVVTKKRDHVEFTVVTQRKDIDTEEVQWVKHVEGKVYPLTEDSQEGFDHRIMDTDKSLVSSEVELAGLDDRNATMSFGPHWQNMRRVCISSKYLYADARLADEFTDELDTFLFHTSVLDASVNAGIQASLQGVYLPFSFGTMKLFHPLTQEVYSRAICKNPNAASDEVYIYDVELVDEENRLLVAIQDYSVKKVHQFTNYEEKNYYRLQWAPQEREVNEMDSLGKMLLIGADHLPSILREKLAEQGSEMLLVNFGDAFERMDANVFVTSPNLEGLRKLISQPEVEGVNTILYATGFHPDEKAHTFSSLQDAMQNETEALFLLTKAMLIEKLHGKVDVILLTDHAYAVTEEDNRIKPEHAALTGLGQCIVQEYANLNVRSIDVDEETPVEEILTEMCAKGNAPRVALRGKRRYVEQLEKFERTALFEEVPTEFSNGCALITGGNGGLGIEAAHYLAEKGAKAICLVSRHALPDQKDWDEIIRSNKQEKLVAKLRCLKEITDSGVVVRSMAADVSNVEAMRTLVHDLCEEFGCISSVFHLAGVAGDGFIINKDLDTFRSVLQPKVYGAKVLEEVLDWSTVQVMVVYSSMTALLGGAGQSDYTAANAYLNAFAQYGRAQNKPILSIAWPAWSETGMAVDYAVSDAQVLFESLDNHSAISYLNDIITYRLSNVVPGKLNYSMLSEMVDELPILMMPSIKKAVERQKKKQKNKGGARRKLDQSEVLIVGKASEDFTETEKTVAYIYAGVMDLDEIDIYENFNALGGNSMTATEILKVLNEYFDNMLDVSDVFSYPTAFEMAEYIDSRREEKKTEGNESADRTVGKREEDMNTLLQQLEKDEIDIEDMIEKIDE